MTMMRMVRALVRNEEQQDERSRYKIKYNCSYAQINAYIFKGFPFVINSTKHIFNSALVYFSRIF